MHKMHRGHKKTPDDELRELAAHMPMGILPWRHRLQFWGLAGLFFAGMAAALGAFVGAGVWLLGLIFWPEPNFWLCWGAGSTAVAIYIGASFLIGKK